MILIQFIPDWYILLIGIEALIWSILIAFVPQLFKYIYLSNVKIQKEKNYLLVNHKKFKYEDILFLSFQEDEDCKIIRIEGKRKQIILPNQKILFTHCKNFQDAIEKANKIRQFINQPIQINYITHIASSYGRKTEKWNFIDV
ncbi:MAG TPA: hypothetical protein PKA54_07180 [Chitinophagaceae bacterium]|nr:hypothetical protein [Chitinophagaceae bacterium]